VTAIVALERALRTCVRRRTRTRSVPRLTESWPRSVRQHLTRPVAAACAFTQRSLGGRAACGRLRNVSDQRPGSSPRRDRRVRLPGCGSSASSTHADPTTVAQRASHRAQGSGLHRPRPYKPGVLARQNRLKRADADPPSRLTHGQSVIATPEPGSMRARPGGGPGAASSSSLAREGVRGPTASVHRRAR
jgi:hypothetical protein